MFSLKDHTSDMRIEIKAKDEKELFENALKGLYSIFLKTKNNPPPKGDITLRITGKDMAQLLVEFLNEIIYLFEVKKMIILSLSDVHIHTKKENLILQCKALYDIYNSTAYEIIGSGVKAATYHDLIVRKSDKGEYYASIVVDM